MADKNKSQIAGADQFLSSEVVIGGGHLACNNSFADWWRTHFSDHASEVTACLKKSKSWTGFTRIGGALWYTSWATTEQETGLSSCVSNRGINLNALSQQSNFRENSRGSYER